MSKKDKYIKQQAVLLHKQYLKDNCHVIYSFEEAIRLGLENADNEELKEDAYTINPCPNSNSYDIRKNNNHLGTLFFNRSENVTKEQTYKAAQAVIASLQEEE